MRQEPWMENGVQVGWIIYNADGSVSQRYRGGVPGTAEPPVEVAPDADAPVAPVGSTAPPSGELFRSADNALVDSGDSSTGGTTEAEAPREAPPGGQSNVPIPVTPAETQLDSIPLPSSGTERERASYNNGSGGSYPRGSYSSAGSSGSYYPSRPSYQDGTTHPAWGGQPRTPGGMWNQSAGQQSAPPSNFTGVAHQSDRPPSVFYRTGGQDRGSGGGGSALYNAWRDKLTSKLYPGSGSGYSGSSASYPSGGTYSQPKEPPEPFMRGAARGFNPDQAGALFTRPTSMIPRVAPGLDVASPMYGMMSEAPAYQFSLLANSRNKAIMPGTTRTVNRGGFKQEVPVRSNSTSQYINGVSDVYKGMMNDQMPSFSQLTDQLVNTKKNSALGQMVRPKPDAYGNYYEPPLQTAQQTVSSMIGAIGSTLDDRAASAYQKVGEGLLDQYGAKAVKKDPRKAPMATKWVGKRLYY